MNRFCFSVFLLFFTACSPKPQPPENPNVWKKIKIDFKQLDPEGLAGKGTGKVVMNYEFCIPADKKNWKTIQKIDRTAQRNTGKGRVGCKDNQWLVVGSTHQKNYQRVIFQLASLPFVERIQEVFWE